MTEISNTAISDDEDDDEDFDANLDELVGYGAPRQRWLSLAVEELKVRFHKCGYELPENLRVSLGWPKGAKGRKGETDTVGQCFFPHHSKDEHFELFISPVVEGEVKLLGILAHELCHALNPTERHGKAFKRTAVAVGLTGPMRATEETEEFTAWVNNEVLPVIGLYPAAPIKREEKPTPTRLLKCLCEGCGYPVRVTKKWLDGSGAPICPTCKVQMQPTVAG